MLVCSVRIFRLAFSFTRGVFRLPAPDSKELFTSEHRIDLVFSIFEVTSGATFR